MSKLASFIVKVEAGSGCLFQPMCGEYSYVLTARHVVEKAKSPISIIKQNLGANGILTEQTFNAIGQPFLHPDTTNIDAAIIKIARIPGELEELLAMLDPLDGSVGFTLAGHPRSRQDSEYSYRENGLTPLVRKQYNYIEAELEKVALYKEINGQSGGGIFHLTRGS